MYENLAYITSGNVEGSTSIQVRSQQQDGETALVYASYEPIGSAQFVSGVANVPLSRPLTSLDILSAYINEFGQKSAPSVLVSLLETSNTGWLIPSTVDGTPYQDWLDDGGAKIPAIYAPELANKVASYRASFKISQSGISAVLEIKPQYSPSNEPQCVASVLSTSGTAANALFSFDDSAPSNSPFKLYTQAQSYSVRIIDSVDTSKYIDIPFSTVLPPEAEAPANQNENIVTVGYVPDGNLAFVNIVAKQLCEISIDGLAQFENTGTQWAQCLSRRVWNGYIEQYALVSGIPEGNQTLRVRLISAPSNEVSISIFI